MPDPNRTPTIETPKNCGHEECHCLAAPQSYGSGEDITSGSRGCGADRATRAAQDVHQRAFARVGSADNRDGRKF